MRRNLYKRHNKLRPLRHYTLTNQIHQTGFFLNDLHSPLCHLWGKIRLTRGVRPLKSICSLYIISSFRCIILNWLRFPGSPITSESPNSAPGFSSWLVPSLVGEVGVPLVLLELDKLICVQNSFWHYEFLKNNNINFSICHPNNQSLIKYFIKSLIQFLSITFTFTNSQFRKF